jgi:hypothetical protein
MKEEKQIVKNLNVRDENIEKAAKSSKGFTLLLLPIALLILILDGPKTPIMYGALAGVVLGGIKSLTKKK